LACWFVDERDLEDWLDWDWDGRELAWRLGKLMRKERKREREMRKGKKGNKKENKKIIKIPCFFQLVSTKKERETQMKKEVEMNTTNRKEKSGISLLFFPSCLDLQKHPFFLLSLTRT
jgi:hypothetical protein